MKEVVKYNNYMNELSFKDFSEYDLNFLMVICSKMKELGEETQYFHYDKLMELLDWDKSKSVDVFHKDLKRMAEKLRHVGATVDINDDVFSAFNLFADFKGVKSKRELTVRINPDFKYILNDLTNNFTKFELNEYVHLDGKYSKLLYQHLKQYRVSGWRQVSVDDLRRELSIPDSMPTRNIVSKVINPSVELIKTCKGFGELEVLILRSPRRGRAVEGYKFTWTADKQVPGQRRIEDYLSEDGQKLEKKRGKVSQNKFNNFPQRSYTPEEMKALEEKLLDN